MSFVETIYNVTRSIREDKYKEQLAAAEDFIKDKVSEAANKGYYYTTFDLYFEPSEDTPKEEWGRDIAHQAYDIMYLVNEKLGLKYFYIANSERVKELENTMKITFHADWAPDEDGCIPDYLENVFNDSNEQ